MEKTILHLQLWTLHLKVGEVLLIGRRLNDRYKVLQVIGGGGMANVYLGRDMILDRDVAIKVLRLDFASDDAFIKRFHREAQSATSIAHPNIVQHL